MDLSLPERAPSMARYHQMPMTPSPLAVYLLVDLDQAEIEELLRVCNSSMEEIDGPNVCLAPQSRYIGGPLREAFDYHLQLGPELTFDPTYFVAVTSQDWRKHGVLLVTLDTDDLECIVDKFIIPARDSAIVHANLQIANTDWYENKEHYESGQGRHGSSDPDHESNDPDEESTDTDHEHDDHHTDAPAAKQSESGAMGVTPVIRQPTSSEERDDGFRDDAPDKKPPAGFYVGIYVSDTMKFQDVVPLLQPAYGSQSPEDYICRFEGALDHNSDMIQQACKLHPQRCTANKHLHKTLFILADSNDFSEDGVILISLGTDDYVRKKPGTGNKKRKVGKADQGTDVQGDSPVIRHQRIPCDPMRTIPLVCVMANGYRPWIYPHWCFALHLPPQIDSSEILPTLDSKLYKRRDGEELVIVCRAPQPVDLSAVTQSQLALSHQQRFRPNLHKQLFVCCDNDEPQSKGMLLVHVEWDSDANKTTQEQMTIAQNPQNISTCRCPMEQVYQKLSDVASGITTWTETQSSLAE